MKSIIKKFYVVVFTLCLIILCAVPAFAASTPCKMEIDGYKTREVYSYSFSADKKTDKNSSDVGKTELGILTVKVSVMNDGTPDLFAYMSENNLKKDGKITVFDAKTGKESKTINFKGASCVGYEEKYDAELGYYEEVQLYCSSLNIGDFKYDRPSDSVYNPAVKSESNALTGTAFSAANIIIICCIVFTLIVVAVAILLVVKKKRAAE